MVILGSRSELISKTDLAVKSQKSPEYVKEWELQVEPRSGFGCGYCIRYLRTWNDRTSHVCAHIEQEQKRKSLDWNRNFVILSLLHHPLLHAEWEKQTQGYSEEEIKKFTWPVQVIEGIKGGKDVKKVNGLRHEKAADEADGIEEGA